MNRFDNIDCLVGMAEYEDNHFDLIVTDPPYGVSLDYNTYEDTEENWYELMDRFIPEAIRVSKMVIFPSCQIKRLEWFYKNHPPDWLISWHKGSTGHSAYIGFNDWEPLVVYGKSKKQLYMHDHYYIQPTEKMGNYGHPCPKPVRWFKVLINKALPDGGIVCDPFVGSGTSLIACEDMGFEYVGFELDEDYYNSAQKRLTQFRSQLKLSL